MIIAPNVIMASIPAIASTKDISGRSENFAIGPAGDVLIKLTIDCGGNI